MECRDNAIRQAASKVIPSRDSRLRLKAHTQNKQSASIFVGTPVRSRLPNALASFSLIYKTPEVHTSHQSTEYDNSDSRYVITLRSLSEKS